MSCEEVRDNLEAWALGALDGDEASAVDAHLSSCAACAALAERAKDDAASLALAVPMESAPAGLKSHIMASAMVDLQSRPRRNWWQAAAAALLVGGAGLLGWSAYLQAEVNDLEGSNASISSAATVQGSDLATMRTELVQASSWSKQLADTQDAVVQIVAQADVLRAPMQGTQSAPAASGRYVWSPSEKLGALVASDLPPLEPGMAYQMWVVHEDGWAPAGSFEVDESGRGRLIVRELQADGDEGAVIGFAVSVEPATGSDTRTGAMVLRTDW